MPTKKFDTSGERRLAKAAQDSLRSQSRVYIKGQIERWLQVGSEKGLKTAEDIARYLLDL